MNKDITSGSLTLSRKIKLTFLMFLLISTTVVNRGTSLAKENFSILSYIEDLQNYSKNKIYFLDARSKWNFFLGHIPGAIHLPDWNEFTETRNGVPGIIIKDLSILANKIAKLGIEKNKKLIIYGDPQNPWRTDGRFLWMFHYLGFKNVSILEGGITLWQKRGKKINRGNGHNIKKSKFNIQQIVL